MKLHHIALTVLDLDISKRFYEDLFGFIETKRFRPDDMRATGVFLQGENIILEIWQFDESKVGTREDLSITGIKHLAFIDENPEALRSKFIEKGISCGPLQGGKSGVVYFFITDPDANQIEIFKSE